MPRRSLIPKHVQLKTTGEFDNAGRPIYEVTENYSFFIGANDTIDIPAGTKTNLATVPRIFWRLIAPTDIMSPAVIHDYMCNEHFGGYAKDSGYSRWMADAVLYEACLRFQRIPKWKANLVYAGVRAYALWKT